MMTVEDIKKQIREQFEKLQFDIQRMEQWVASGFTPNRCMEHNLVLYDNVFDEVQNKILLSYQCRVCGIDIQKVYNYGGEVMSDDWEDIRTEEE